MEGRGFSDLLRNTSEEIFLKTMMENPIGITAPSMEMLGFKNISQSFRGDSEELFTSWLSNGEIPSYSSSAVAHRTRQASRRLSTDIASSQQNGASFQKKGSDDNAPTINLNTIDEDSNDLGLDSFRNAAEKEMQASNLYLAKAWFHSSQPMTRSRSSELRRRYAAMQSSQLSGIPQAPNNIPAHGTNKMQLDFSNANDFHNIQSNQMHSFMSPSNSSTSFNATPVGAADTVSSVVSMLRGTLERKKLNSINEKEKMEGSSYDMLCSHEAVPSTSHNQGLSSQVVGPTTSLHIGSAGPVNLARAEKPLELSMEGFPTWANQAQIGAASQEPSQSESSTAAPALSTGFEVCDGPTYSGHTMSNGVSSSRHVGNDTSNQELKANDYRDRVFVNSFKDERKKPNLVRMGSLTSTASDDKADPTKKRRVERSRKMAEAKEKYSTPPIPSNMQSVLKRCENLEKEVRSLKLNLSFMNRKDSEQTKQIEELQKQKDELVNEKERLLEEIERIVSDSGNM